MKKNNQEDFFCTRCGAKMNHTTKPQKSNMFDAHTGEPTNAVYNYYKCPNKKVFFDGHDQYDDEPVSID